jgi:hypothetical protein
MKNMPGGKPPRVSNIVKRIKNSFPEFEGNNRAEIVVETSPARR